MPSEEIQSAVTFAVWNTTYKFGWGYTVRQWLTVAIKPLEIAGQSVLLPNITDPFQVFTS